MVGFTANWVHGNSVVMEAPPREDGGVFAFNHFGWGTQITMRPGFSRWFHIAIPAPVMLDGKRMNLIRAFLQFNQVSGFANSGMINDVTLWDGQTRVAAQSAREFKSEPSVTLPLHRTFELSQPRPWGTGVGLSFQLSCPPALGGHIIDNSEAPVIRIGSAGADFQP